MRVLLVHNEYRLRGGEDQAVDLLMSTLIERGHAVEAFIERSDAWETRGAFSKAATALSTPYSLATARKLKARISAFRPDVVHVHNIFPFLTPSVYSAASAAGVPVVQTLHNFRWFCMNGLLFRDGAPCEDCLDHGSPVPGALHACYQGSRVKSAMMAFTLALHRATGTWSKRISAYIALSDFSRQKYVAAGFPPEKLHIVRNGVEIPAEGPAPASRPTSFFFLGRLSEEKGVDVMLEADSIYRRAGGRSPLVIAGDGPLAERVMAHQRAHPDAAIRIVGRVDEARKSQLFSTASHLLFPSVCYENCPYTVLESLAAGVPVIGFRRGGVPELIENEGTGRLVAPGRASEFAAAMAAADSDGARWPAMSAACRGEAEARFRRERWLTETEGIYRAVMGANRPSAKAI